jgi:hypothetical protein
MVGGISVKNLVGKCYILSANYVIEHLGWSLVHGTIKDPMGHNPYVQIGHAWVEKDNQVYDPVMESKFDRDLYGKLFRSKVIKIYDRDETVKMLLKTKNYGPWHKNKKENIRRKP